MARLSVNVSEPRPDCRQIEVVGELDLAVVGQLEEAIGSAAEAPEVLVDLRGCEFLDSTGIAVLLGAYRERVADGRRFAVFGPRDQVLRVLEVTGLADNGLVFATAEEAAGHRR